MSHDKPCDVDFEVPPSPYFVEDIRRFLTVKKSHPESKDKMEDSNKKEQLEHHYPKEKKEDSHNSEPTVNSEPK